jgi:hypothetical protein
MRPLHLFLLVTFVLFIVGFAGTGMLSLVGSPHYLVVLAQMMMAWTPTAAFVIIHRKVNPGRSYWRYIADLFAPRIRLQPLLASLLIPVVATIVAWKATQWFLDRRFLISLHICHQLSEARLACAALLSDADAKLLQLPHCLINAGVRDDGLVIIRGEKRPPCAYQVARRAD